MTRLHFVGQAPARSGDGRPFTGHSGQRLCQLLDLVNYEALARRFDLENLLDRPMEKHSNGRGDAFERDAGVTQGRILVRQWLKQDELVPVVACGHQVFKSLTGTAKPFFKGKTIRKVGHSGRVEVWNFPHPSGASAYWNDPKKYREAQAFLRRLVKRYGINMQ